MKQHLLSILAKTDRFTNGIIICVILGLLLPCHGIGADIFDWLTNAAIILLFFLYGVKLSRQSVIDGLLHWRLQAIVAFFTFIFFPIFFSLVQPLGERLVGSALYMGLIYVACLPSTVQSSIAFTSVAGGNVPAAVCSASASSLLGVFLTPLHQCAHDLALTGGNEHAVFHFVTGFMCGNKDLDLSAHARLLRSFFLS